MENCAVHEEQIKQLQLNDGQQWEHINGLEKAMQRFVPVWTALILMGMSAMTASALTFAGMIIRMKPQ
jgi:hypothetical protein